MKCVLSGPNSRILAKAVQSLAKFGTDLYIEADPNRFQLRSVNANKSAVATFKFFTRFFDSYDVSGGSSDEENYCRLSIKACLGVFKCMKQVETCHIEIQPDRSKFLIQMNCKHEIVKHFIVSIIDDDNITADVPLDDLPNTIGGSYKIFQEIASNFQMSEEEITLEARLEKLNVQNYIEGSRVNDKFMKSQLKLASSEFENYNVPEETTVTFCLKEFRAFLLFSESLYESVNIKFQEAGSPIVFEVKKPNFFEGMLIMSTLAPDDVTMCEDVQQKEITESFISRAAAKSATKRKPAKASVKESKRLNNTSRANSSTQEKTPEASENESIFRFDRQSIDVARNNPSSGSSTELPRIPNISLHSEAMETDAKQTESEVFVTFVETEENVGQEDQEEQIGQSPGNNDRNRKELRSIFSRCFEATYVPREPSPNSLAYVPDSDDEN